METQEQIQERLKKIEEGTNVIHEQLEALGSFILKDTIFKADLERISEELQYLLAEVDELTDHGDEGPVYAETISPERPYLFNPFWKQEILPWAYCSYFHRPKSHKTKDIKIKDTHLMAYFQKTGNTWEDHGQFIKIFEKGIHPICSLSTAGRYALTFACLSAIRQGFFHREIQYNISLDTLSVKSMIDDETDFIDTVMKKAVNLLGIGGKDLTFANADLLEGHMDRKLKDGIRELTEEGLSYPLLLTCSEGRGFAFNPVFLMFGKGFIDSNNIPIEKLAESTSFKENFRNGEERLTDIFREYAEDYKKHSNPRKITKTASKKEREAASKTLSVREAEEAGYTTRKIVVPDTRPQDQRPFVAIYKEGLVPILTSSNKLMPVIEMVLKKLVRKTGKGIPRDIVELNPMDQDFQDAMLNGVVAKSIRKPTDRKQWERKIVDRFQEGIRLCEERNILCRAKREGLYYINPVYIFNGHRTKLTAL